ncbi:hypothetical protein [Xenococcus sp. PCC 7305]|uniref:hypothetical protein n=1 Tax=Xenococcus sp. PCC 7305 TaxID=102125 RepID=UPI0002DD68EC|nr:hypothetical protein [Xenococcus sp. PCC 7305]
MTPLNPTAANGWEIATVLPKATSSTAIFIGSACGRTRSNSQAQPVLSSDDE